MDKVMEGAIEIRDLRVDYGNFIAVHDVCLTVPWGEVFGLVGPNGAGKTSTFRVLATLMEPTYGEVCLAGIDVLEETSAARRIMGYMPDLAPVPSDLKVGEFLEFHADTHALGTRARRRERVDECLELVNLADKRTAWCKALSRGQTQRVVLAKTLLHRPRVLILDEPTAGLDPISATEFDELVRYLHANLDLTIVLVTHDVDTLFGVCDRVAVLVNKGIIVDTLDEIVNHPDPWIQEYFGDPRAVRARKAASAKVKT